MKLYVKINSLYKSKRYKSGQVAPHNAFSERRRKVQGVKLWGHANTLGKLRAESFFASRPRRFAGTLQPQQWYYSLTETVFAKRR